jgi:hypothetical protein
MQRQLEVAALPDAALDAAGTFMAFHLEAARGLLGQIDCTALAIILPPAPHDHTDWRRTLARDLAREVAPKRVNVVAGIPGVARNSVLHFLAGAPGVTGQYLSCHE